MGPCTLMSWCAAWNSALYCACVHRGNALLPVPKLTTWSAWLTQVVAVGSAACMLLRNCCTAGQARPRTLPVRGTVRLPSDTCRVHPVCQPGRCLSKLANGATCVLVSFHRRLLAKQITYAWPWPGLRGANGAGTARAALGGLRCTAAPAARALQPVLAARYGQRGRGRRRPGRARPVAERRQRRRGRGRRCRERCPGFRPAGRAGGRRGAGRGRRARSSGRGLRCGGAAGACSDGGRGAAGRRGRAARGRPCDTAGARPAPCSKRGNSIRQAAQRAVQGPNLHRTWASLNMIGMLRLLLLSPNMAQRHCASTEQTVKPYARAAHGTTGAGAPLPGAGGREPGRAPVLRADGRGGGRGGAGGAARRAAAAAGAARGRPARRHPQPLPGAPLQHLTTRNRSCQKCCDYL